MGYPSSCALADGNQSILWDISVLASCVYVATVPFFAEEGFELDDLQGSMRVADEYAKKWAEKFADQAINAELQSKIAELDSKDLQLERKDAELDRKDVELDRKDAEIKKLKLMMKE